MNQKTRRTPRAFDDQFLLSVLKEYYEGSASLNSVCRKYSINTSNFRSWERKYEEKSLSLPQESSELLKRMTMAKKEHERLHPSSPSRPLSREEALEDENRRLRTALRYSELRNEALMEVLKIGREKYGVDLLKKAGAKQ